MIQEKSIVQQIFAKVWWLVLLRGIAVTLLGMFLIVRPAGTLLVLVRFLGAYWFVDGIFTSVNSIRGRQFHPNWGSGLFVGIISILAGAIVFLHPVMSATLSFGFVVYLVAFISMFSGISSVITGIRLRKEIDNEWSMILGGVAFILFGVLLIVNPFLPLSILVLTIGICALAAGIFLIVLSFRFRKIANEGLAAVRQS